MKKELLAATLVSAVLFAVVLAPRSCSLAAPAVTPSALPKAIPVVAGGTPVISAGWRDSLVTGWKTDPTFGSIEASPNGLKLSTFDQPPHLYDLQTKLLNQVPVAKGDTLIVRFAARSLQSAKISGVTKLRTGFGKASPDWDSSLNAEVSLSDNWERYDFPFTCKNDFKVNEAQMTFTFGFPAQQVEIADLSVLRFGPEVSPDSLPKTRRTADKLAPEIVQGELDRVVKLEAELAAVKDPAPANGTFIYVAKTGGPTGDGSAARPFATIPQALAVVKPGDTIQVGAGEYREPRGISIRTSGRPDAWIHLQAAPGARPKLITSNWSGIEMRGGIAYIEVKGFELEWVPDAEVAAANPKGVYGVGIAPMYATHHIRILNNVVHGYGTSGIGSLDCDYLDIEGNVIYNCAKTSPYGGSGISLCRAFNFDEDPGYHNVVSGNVCYDNELLVPVLTLSGGNGKALTDGNGIIIDSFVASRANPLKPHGEDRNGPLLPYRQRTLVENNLVYDNGGRGIHVFRSDKVDIINNTTYMNQKTPEISGGEITFIQSVEGVIANNICWARAGKRANTQDGSSLVVWKNNLFYNSDDVLLHDGLIQADPQFVAAALDAKPDGFRLKPNSPAIDKGLPAIAPPLAIDGTPRKKSGPVNLGAY